MVLRIAIVGAGGRMGRQLIQAVQNAEGVVLGAAFERKGSSLVNADAGELAGIGHLGIQVGDDLNAAKEQFDVLIDFTRPEGTWNIWHFVWRIKKISLLAQRALMMQAKRQLKPQQNRLALCLPLTSAWA